MLIGSDPEVFGDLRVEIEPLLVVNEQDMLVIINFVNASKKPLWVALHSDLSGGIKGALFNSAGDQYECHTGLVTGIAAGQERLLSATELQPKGSVTATLQFRNVFKKIKPGTFRLQLEVLTSTNFDGNEGEGVVHNLVTKVELK
jgi:hypothetical protein